MSVHGVPDAIDYDAVIRALAELGIDPDVCRGVTITPGRVVVNVLARDSNGHFWCLSDDVETHSITVRVTPHDNKHDGWAHAQIKRK